MWRSPEPSPGSAVVVDLAWGPLTRHGAGGGNLQSLDHPGDVHFGLLKPISFIPWLRNDQNWPKGPYPNQTCAWFHRNRFWFRNRFRLSRNQSRNQSWIKTSPLNQNRNRFRWAKVGIGIESANEWLIPAPMIHSDLFAPNTLGRCDFFTATGDFTAMPAVRSRAAESESESESESVNLHRLRLRPGVGVGYRISSLFPC